jgi:surfactin synthase thioesterase subunit
MLVKPEITLYCLPFAGGNAFSYRHFQAHLADAIQVIALELPGRGKRFKEPLLTTMEAMIVDMFLQIQKGITPNNPYAIYGHSMGALLGYELTRYILYANLPPPQHLFFSGRRAPSVPDDLPLKHSLPKEEFMKAVKDLGGCPPELLAHQELTDLFEPILRADFQAIETYVYTPASPINVPITLLHGSDDEEVTYDQLLPWQQETRQQLIIQSFLGDHFFIFEHLAQIGRLLSQTLIPQH